jgi:hypothetical protein
LLTEVCHLFFSEVPSQHWDNYAHMIYKFLASIFFLIEPTCVIGIKIQINCWLGRRWKSNIKRKQKDSM